MAQEAQSSYENISTINDFTTKLLIVNFLVIFIQGSPDLKGTKKFGSKVISRQLFHRKTGL